MTVSLTTRGILCISSPTTAILTWGIICYIPASLYAPSFIVGVSPISPDLMLLGRKQVDLVESVVSLVKLPISPEFTSTVSVLIPAKDVEMLGATDNTIINKPESELINVSDEEVIYNKEDPELINDPK